MDKQLLRGLSVRLAADPGSRPAKRHCDDVLIIRGYALTREQANDPACLDVLAALRREVSTSRLSD